MDLVPTLNPGWDPELHPREPVYKIRSHLQVSELRLVSIYLFFIIIFGGGDTIQPTGRHRYSSGRYDFMVNNVRNP